MNTINATTFRQFDALAPQSLTLAQRSLAGRTFKRSTTLYSDDDCSVRFDYTSRKRRDAFVADKLSICVRYVHGRDLYVVGVLHFDGESFESTQIASFDDVYFAQFADVQQWLDSAAA